MTPKLVRVTRLDSMPITRAQYTEEGYLIDKPILTSTGIFEYHNPDGSVRRELRLPEEVFAADSLASYKGKPIIITHDAGLIDKDNVSREQIGTIMSEGFKDGDDVRAEIEIHDTDKMKRSGYKELSLGYNLDLDETPGVYKGQRYDAIQRNIFINHLALVENARAGEQARLNIDSRDKKSQKVRNDLMAKTKKTSRGDGILSPDELKNAIAEYRKNHPKTDADEELKKEENAAPVETSPVSAPFAAPAADPDDDKKVAAAADDDDADMTIEEKVQEIRDAHKDDDDAQMLCDIIDTLLAKMEFNDADAPAAGTVATDSDDDDENCDADEDDDDTVNDDDIDDINKLKGDEDDDEENADEDDDDIDDPDDTDDIDDIDDAPDTDDDDDLNEDEDDDDDDDTDGTPLPNMRKNATMNADSIDRIVRERIKLGMIGRAINLDGLENKDILSAKKAIIKRMRPGIRLDGKSAAYIAAAYDCAVEDIKSNSAKGTKAQRKQMFNKDAADKKRVPGTSADQARKRMIDRMNNKSK